METFTGTEVAEVVGADLAAQLGVDEGEYTADEVARITDVLGESAELAESVADGEADLATLFTPEFMAAHTEFDDFEAFLESSPWTESEITAAFAGETPEGENPAAANSTFLSRTTEFETPGAMVQTAIIDRTRRKIASD
jgi:hypothetical protein